LVASGLGRPRRRTDRQGHRHRLPENAPPPGGIENSKHFVDEHLDQLLKATDELVGKLLALGKEDFHPIRVLDMVSTLSDNNELGGLVFLFARFWAQIEIIKREGLSITISHDERGKRLENFLDCLESTRVRLVDRTGQRAVAETVLETLSGKLQTIAYIEFIRRSPEPETARWIEPIRTLLVRAWHTTQRQKLLQYGIVLHALIDTLDEKHLVTRDRPGLPGKLSRQTWRDLNYRVFRVYLPFVVDRKKYLGLPR